MSVLEGLGNEEPMMKETEVSAARVLMDLCTGYVLVQPTEEPFSES